METPLISKRQFNKIRKFLPVRNHARRLDDRMVISGIIFIIKNGLGWRQLPEFYGNWKTVYSRFRRWNKLGIIIKIFHYFTKKLPKRCIAMIDSTFSKAQRSACSMRSDGLSRELGRSRGGITTKIHLLCNSFGQPMDFFITAGNVADIKIAPVLTSRNKMKVLIADKAYGAKSFRANLREQKVKDCIPAKCNEKSPEEYDGQLYKKRHVIENMFMKLKDWKGIAFRGIGGAYNKICVNLR